MTPTTDETTMSMVKDFTLRVRANNTNDAKGKRNLIANNKYRLLYNSTETILFKCFSLCFSNK